MNDYDSRYKDDPDPYPLYPEIEVQLTGTDGNAFAIIGKVRRALIRHDLPRRVATDFVNEATSGDYDHVLITAQRFVTCN